MSQTTNSPTTSHPAWCAMTSLRGGGHLESPFCDPHTGGVVTLKNIDAEISVAPEQWPAKIGDASGKPSVWVQMRSDLLSIDGRPVTTGASLSIAEARQHVAHVVRAIELAEAGAESDAAL